MNHYLSHQSLILGLFTNQNFPKIIVISFLSSKEALFFNRFIFKFFKYFV